MSGQYFLVHTVVVHFAVVAAELRWKTHLVHLVWACFMQSGCISISLAKGSQCKAQMQYNRAQKSASVHSLCDKRSSMHIAQYLLYSTCSGRNRHLWGQERSDWSVRLSQQILLLLRGKLMTAGLQHQETAGGHRETKSVLWSSKVCIQNQSLLSRTVRVRWQLNLTGGTAR